MLTNKKLIFYLLFLSIGSFFTAQACTSKLIPIQLSDATIMLSQEQINAIPALKGIQYFNPLLSVFDNLDSSKLFIILDLLQSKNNEELYEKLKTFTGSQNPTDDLNNLWNLAEITEYLIIEIFNQKLSVKIIKYLVPLLAHHYDEENALEWIKEKEQTLFFNALGLELKKELATYYFHEPVKIKETTLANYLPEKENKQSLLVEKRKLFISSINSDSVVISDNKPINQINETEYEDIFTLTRNSTNHLLPIKKASLSSNKHFLITQSDDALVVTQITENKQITRIPFSLPMPYSFLNKIDISSDNNYLISYSSNKINVMDLISKRTNTFSEQSYRAHDQSNVITNVYLTKCSQFLIIITNKNITITYLKTKKIFKVLSSSAIVLTTAKTLSFVNDGNLELYLTNLSTLIANQCTLSDIYKAIKAQQKNPLDKRISIDRLNDNFFVYYTEPKVSFEKPKIIMNELEEDTNSPTEPLEELNETQESFLEDLLTLSHASPIEKTKKLYLCLTYCLKKTIVKATKILLEDTTNRINPFTLELSDGIQELAKEGELL